MVHVAHVITGLGVGGAEMMLLKLISALDRTRIQSSVISLTAESDLAEPIRNLGVPVWSVRMSRKLPSPLGVLRLRRILRSQRPHIVQTWLYHADFLGLVAARSAGISRVVWNLRCSELDLNQYSAAFRMILRILAHLSRAPAAVVVNSESGRRAHEQLGYAPRSWHMISNGIDPSAYRPDPDAGSRIRRSLGIPEQAPVIGMVARLDPLKDHRTFGRAAEQSLAKQPDAHFILAGKGMERTNGALRGILPEGLISHANLHLVGQRSDVPALMNAFDVCTLTSSTEGFPNVVPEAMSCGVPCVVTDVGDAAMIVGDTGIVVPPGNAPALVDAWKHLLDQPRESRQSLGIRARQRVVEKYSLRAAVAQYESLYERIAANS